MTGLKSKLSAKQQQAIAELLVQPSLAEVARATGVKLHVLQRWLKELEFGAAYRAAKRALHRQNRRYLGQGFTAAVKSTLQLMRTGKRDATRLRAARDIIALANEANEIEDFAAAVAEAERFVAANRAGSLAAGKAGTRGHGSKRPRVEEKAISALLTQRSIAAAARVTGISVQTLHRWMEEPSFLARLAAAADEVFKEGMRLAQLGEDDAVLVIRSMSADRSIPEETRRQANHYVTRAKKAQVIEDLDTRTADMVAETGSAEGTEPQEQWKTLGRNLYQRLKRIKASLSPPDRPPMRIGCDEDPQTSLLIGKGWCTRTEDGGWSEPSPENPHESPPFLVPKMGPEKEAA